MWWTKKNNNNRERNQRFYTSTRWRRLQAYVLNIKPLCPDCLPLPVAATEVHHVNNINTVIGWNLRLSLIDDEGNVNLIGYCKAHHARITQIEQKQLSGKPVKSSQDRMNELKLN